MPSLADLCLAIGEISSILVRGIFSVLVAICDVLASVACCWRVPYDERPDRQTYQYNLAAVGKPVSPQRPSVLTKAGRDQRAKERQEKKAAERERQLKLQEEKHQKQLAANEEKDAKKQAAAAEKQQKQQEALQAKEDALKEKKEATAQAAADNKAAALETPATEA